MTGASGAPAGGAVVVVDGVDVPASPSAAVPATAAAWLAEWAPRGVYTATRTTDHHARLSRWDAHVKRLRLMLSAFRDHDPASFASAPELPATDEAMRALVAPTVDLALARRRAMTANVVEGIASESMVVVAVSPTARGAWRVGAHACAFDAAAKLPRATCAVAPGSRRTCPSVKDTSWPRLRNAIVAATTRARGVPPFDEILLSDADGDALFEGGVSNVFVVVKETKNENDRRSVGSEPSQNSEFFVQTAPVEECLAGVGRAAVLDALTVLGVRVVEKTPRLSEKGSLNGEVWCEAFLTNAVRGVRGVREIRFSEDVRVTFASHGTETSIASRLDAYFDESSTTKADVQ
jgi:branched-subunit amino acid aminotransferase/4-amino-4-deoxychorismate lyase